MSTKKNHPRRTPRPIRARAKKRQAVGSEAVQVKVLRELLKGARADLAEQSGWADEYLATAEQYRRENEALQKEVDRLRTLVRQMRWIVIEHHSSKVMKPEICPVCTSAANAEILKLSTVVSPPPSRTSKSN